MVKKYFGEGLVLSGAVHLGLVAVALFGLPHMSRPTPEVPDVVPVDFIEIADVTRTDKPPPEKQPEPEPEPEPTLAKSESVPEQQVAEAVPLPAEEKPKPPEKTKAPEPEPKPAPPKPRITVEPRSKPRPPSRFDASRVTALIDRSIKEETHNQQPSDEKPEEKSERKAQPQTALSDRIATATLQAAIRQRVQECWYVPGGAKDLGKMQVRIRIQLRQDGHLLRPPQVLDAGDTSRPGQEYYRIFVESARRAVQSCEPYDNLPLAQYEVWRQIDFTFDAADMLGG